MRDLMYRQWQPALKKFHYWGYLEGDDTFACPIHGDSQQFTGLFDKNNKEIFEGDIVTLAHGEYKGTNKIRFINGAFLDGDYPLADVDFKDGAELEIIGNIYSNPELLPSKRSPLNLLKRVEKDEL